MRTRGGRSWKMSGKVVWQVCSSLYNCHHPHEMRTVADPEFCVRGGWEVGGRGLGDGMKVCQTFKERWPSWPYIYIFLNKEKPVFLICHWHKTGQRSKHLGTRESLNKFKFDDNTWKWGRVDKSDCKQIEYKSLNSCQLKFSLFWAWLVFSLTKFWHKMNDLSGCVGI